MSVYRKTKANELENALHSIWTRQSLKPNQIVLVQDGEVQPDTAAIIESWQIKLPDILITSKRPHQGLANSLNHGLNLCTNKVVARMDADDESLASRFELQISFLKNNPSVDVLGGQISEWNKSLSTFLSKKKLPTKHSDIVKFAKWRCPVNHPTVVFKKAAVINVGAYPTAYPEDYLLWIKLICAGYTFANLPDEVLKMRIEDAIDSRRGLDFLKGEIQTFYFMKQKGMISYPEFLFNILIRVVLRLSPRWMKGCLYRLVRR